MALRNWAGNIEYAAARLHRPSTVEELQHLVATTPRIRAFGTGHTFNRVADTDGDLVSVADLSVRTDIDPQNRTVVVGGGTRYAQLAAELDAAGWALPNLGSLPHISVAGACATGTHGSGDANRCLAAGVVAVEFVRADGELVRIASDEPAFAGSVVALGALGIVTTLTVRIEPSFEVRQDVWLDAPLATVLDRLDEIMAAGYSVSLFTSWRRPDVVDAVWVKTRRHHAVADGRGWGARPAERPQHPIAGAEPAAATEQLGVSGPWHARLPHFRAEFVPSAGEEQQSEYLLPRAAGPAAIAAIVEVAEEVCPAVQVSEIRTVAADELWLSPCHDRDTLALHFTWVDDDDLVGRAVAAVEAALEPFQARPHWGKVFTLPPEQVRSQYPRLGEFAALAAEHDPGRKFGNAFLENYVY